VVILGTLISAGVEGVMMVAAAAERFKVGDPNPIRHFGFALDVQTFNGRQYGAQAT